ncbi:NB-ARC domain-containing protein [Nocardiopsis alba]|uniref:NB-ARC domain-containing protein n=1 Tax=Nocardiopsis alba TaxID=53437 RepID=UPI003D7175B1
MNDDTPEPRQVRSTIGGDVGGTAIQAGAVGRDVNVTNVLKGKDHRPLQVERPPHDFVNRHDPLEWIGSTLSSGSSPRVVLCEGPLGIGKTTFIRKIAEIHQDYFSGGQLGFEYRRGLYEDPDTAITGFLRALGMERNSIPNTPAERAKEYRSLTRRRPCLLVVVEGAWEPAQVRALVPEGNGSLVLVSSDVPDLDELLGDPRGAHPHSLVPLDPEHARALLESRAARSLESEDPEAIERLLEVCAGLPLAIALVGGRLCRMGLGSATTLAEDMERAPSAPDSAEELRRSLGVIFETSYRALSPEAAAVYRALGDWPGPHLDRALMPLLGDEGRWEEILAANLVEMDTHTLRFRHELIRGHARDRAEEDGAGRRRARLTAMLDAYLVRLGFAELAARGERLRTLDLGSILTGAEDPFDGDTGLAKAWLLRERPTLLSVVLGSAEQGLHVHAHRFAELAPALYLDHRFVHDWATTAVVGADSARMVGDTAAEAGLLSLGSRPLTDLGRHAEAGARLDRAAELVEGMDDLMLRASVLEFRGRHLAETDPEAAIDAYDRCIEANRASDLPGSERGEALGLLFRGQARVRAGQAEAAVADIEAALTRFEGLSESDDRMSARGRVWLGEAHAAAGRHREAITALNLAIEGLGARDQHYYRAEAYVLLADLYEEIGASGEARARLVEAERLYRDLESPRAAAVAERITRSGPTRD